MSMMRKQKYHKESQKVPQRDAELPRTVTKVPQRDKKLP